MAPMDRHALFTHEPLDRSLSQIRLISIFPEAEGPVRCTVKHIDLDTNPTPDYRALSYTWGPPSPSYEIYINGRLLIVRLNLYEFLLTFRKRLYKFRGGESYEDELQWLWIDQICIDQSVIEERNHQVRMMSSIYKRATYVYVWLGSSDERTEAAMQTVKSGFRRYHDNKYTLATKARHRSGIEKSSPIGRVQEMKAGSIEALRRFFQNPYWKRLWIVQEVMLARYIRIMCGDTLLSWEELRRFCVSGRSYLPPDATSGIPAQVVWLAEHALSAKEYSYISLLRTFSKTECQYPRDKVYGFQGLLVKKDQTSIDYSKSVGAVFIDAASTLARGARAVAMTSYRTIVQEFDCCRTIPELFGDICMAFRKEQESRIRFELFEALVELEDQMSLGFTRRSETVAMDTVMKEINAIWTHLASVYARDYERYHGHQQTQPALTTEEAIKRMLDHQLDVSDQKESSEILAALYEQLALILGHIAHDLHIPARLRVKHTWLNDVEDPRPVVDPRYPERHQERTMKTFEVFAAMEEFRSFVESTTRHMITDTWQYDLVVSAYFRFLGSGRDTVNITASGRTTHIEYTLRHD
ncbi:hypothetical protein M3J09_013476 [Ascochyta lentis]